MERIEKLKEYLQASPHDSFVQHALALEFIKLGHDAEAKNLFENILQREPGYVGSYYHLARVLERMGKTESAIKICEQGMGEAKKRGDNLAYNELKGIYEDLVY